MKTENNTN